MRIIFLIIMYILIGISLQRNELIIHPACWSLYGVAFGAFIRGNS